VGFEPTISAGEQSYRLCCVVVCDLETSRMGAPYIYDISRLRVKYPKGLNRILIFLSWMDCVFSYIISVSSILILSSWLPVHPQNDYVNLLSPIVKLSSVQFVCSQFIVSESILKTSFQYLPKQRMRMYTVMVPANAHKYIEISFYTH